MPTRSALVTGGAGFIGSHIVDFLMESGWDVTVIDDFSSGRINNVEPYLSERRFKLLKGSIVDDGLLRKGLKDVDCIFHFAAITSVAGSIADPRATDRVNTHGTVSLLNRARQENVGTLVFASSAAVYGNAHRPPLTEDLLPAPASPYGVTKLAGEDYCRAFSATYGLKTISLRFFNVYGPRCVTGDYAGVLMNFSRRVRSGKAPMVYGDGLQTRDFVSVDDAVRAAVIAADSKAAPGEVFNVGTGRGTSIKWLAELVMSEYGVSRRIVRGKARKGEVRHSWASLAKTEKGLGFAPKTSLRSGIRKFVSWYDSGPI